MCPKLLGNGMRYAGFSWMRAAGLSCVRKGPWWDFFSLIFFFMVILPLVLDMGAVGVVLLWWKNRCADKRPISMDCR